MEKEKLREIVKKAVSDSWHIGNAFDPVADQTEAITESLHQALSMSGVVNRKKKSKCDYCDDSGAMPFSSTKKCPLCQ